MLIKFCKMQALGNDFVIIESRYSENAKLFKKDFLVNISHRLFGVGCDQVVIFYRENCFIHASFFNNDGSEAEICGNASRCLGKLMKRNHGISKFPMIAAGKEYGVQVNADDTVSVNIGRPSFESSFIGLSRNVVDYLDLVPEIDLGIERNVLNGIDILKIACISVGNPHLVIFCREMPPIEVVVEIGRTLSNNDLFSNGVNVSFAKVTSDKVVEQCSFERGTGLTLACGSGACATAFLANRYGFIKSSEITIQQRGGSLLVILNEDETVTQTGAASYVFSGEIEL